MLKDEERLFDEFKRVDRICGDMFSCQHGISRYIDEMDRTSVYDRRNVALWDRDYRNLKRVRWLRNQIVHEVSAPDCSDCDVEWLEDFHARILTQQDPLAVLRESSQERRKRVSSCVSMQKEFSNMKIESSYEPRKPVQDEQRGYGQGETRRYDQDKPKRPNRLNACLAVAVIILLATIFAILCLRIVCGI